jgi:anti-sigma28 factor (negative regulator of flagellin synthesis)
MRIDQHNAGLNIAGGGPEKIENTGGAGTPAPGQRRQVSGQGDAVSLSNLSRKIEAHGVDEAQRGKRVEELARLYASGNYAADARQVSERLIEEALAAGAGT